MEWNGMQRSQELDVDDWRRHAKVTWAGDDGDDGDDGASAGGRERAPLPPSARWFFEVAQRRVTS